jgi:4-amino-4-deoxy-L-arabinose transferase-like glycosyltransferase
MMFPSKTFKPALSWYGWAALGVCLVFAAVGARWIWLYRHGQAVDIDEAGYLSIALSDYNAWIRGGPLGWLGAIFAPNQQAPLTTEIASLLFLLTGPHIIAGFFVPLTAGAICIWLVYMMGATLGSRTVGLCACLVLAACPVMSFYSRSFHFGMLAALTTTGALLAMVRSNRFERPWPVALFGVCLGLMPLSRGMTIAFIPGVIVAALVFILAEPVRLGHRFKAFALSLILAALVSASWLIPSAGPVFSYLFSFGYGARAAEFGAQQSKFGPDAWFIMTKVMGDRDVYLPHLIFVVSGIAALLTIAATRLIGNGPWSGLKRMMQSALFPLFLACAEMFLALLSSQNKGSAFFSPLMPTLLVIATWGLFKFRGTRIYRAGFVAAVGLITLIAGVPDVDLRSPFSAPWMVTLPGIGQMTMTDGRGTLQLYAAGAELGAANISQPMDDANGRAWMNLSTAASAAVTPRFGLQPIVAFGFRNALFNLNTVNLAHIIATGLPFAARQIEPSVIGTSGAGYLQWLRSIMPDTCALLTSNLAHGEFSPKVDGLVMEEAARQAGFIPGLRLTAPDGRPVTIWSPPTMPSNCR